MARHEMVASSEAANDTLTVGRSLPSVLQVPTLTLAPRHGGLARMFTRTTDDNYAVAGVAPADLIGAPRFTTAWLEGGGMATRAPSARDGMPAELANA